MAELVLQNLRKAYGAVEILQGIDLTIEKGEFIAVVGPSGCGKSTLLRAIAGLEDITDGTLTIGGKRVNDLPPGDRGIAMVFQSYALYPHLSVFDNMAFGLKLAGLPKAQIAEKVNNAAEILQITHLLDRKPRDLSGGQRQRVAIGRAIVREPDVFLFDEPLSNLDASLRGQTRLEIAKLHENLNATMIYVTHDQVEAMTLADRIVVLNKGRLEQVGTPLELYNRPANLFVAGFLGSPRINLLPVTIAGGGPNGLDLTLPGGATLHLPVARPLDESDKLTLGIRPEHLRLTENPGLLRATVRHVEILGDVSLLHLALPDGHNAILRADGQSGVQIGQQVALTFDAAACHLFDGADQALPGLSMERTDLTMA